MAVFGPKILIFKGGSKTFGTLVLGSPLDTCFVFKKIDRRGSNGPQGQKSAILTQKSIFCFGIAIFCQRAYHQYALGYPEEIFHRKQFSVSEVWVVFPGIIPVFGHFGPVLNRKYKYFGPWSTKLGGTHIENGPGPGRNYGETAIFYVLTKTVIWTKIR